MTLGQFVLIIFGLEKAEQRQAESVSSFPYVGPWSGVMRGFQKGMTLGGRTSRSV